MKIRSITCFYNPVDKEATRTLQRMSELIREARDTFLTIDCEVQTARLATTPFMGFFPRQQPGLGVDLAKQFDAQVKELGFDYLSLGPAPIEEPGTFQLIPRILAAAENTFLSACIADTEHGISLPAVQEAARTIHKIAKDSPDGFANLRFAALANTSPFTPFFPGAYSTGSEAAFAFAMQTASDILEAFSTAESFAQAREKLTTQLEHGAERIEGVARGLAKKYKLEFKGFDFSSAPFPDENTSAGKALEVLGVARLGFSGSLAAAAFLADCLQQGKWKKTGFNGVMLPVLEDSYLAMRSSEGTLGVYDLLLYSAVCGTGLDTVPLPGDITPDEIEGLLLDMAALALRLDKPLTARLMPIPGKRVGQRTEFQFDYFANGRVLDFKSGALKGLLKGEEYMKLAARKAGKESLIEKKTT
jgi:uncharacterized protein (UPF0210 family)